MLDQSFLHAVAFFVSLVILLFLVSYLVYMIDIVFVGHDFATTNRGVRKIAEILVGLGKSKSKLLDLGSSRGGFALRLAKASPNLEILGIDRSAFRTIIAKSGSWISGHPAKFLQADMFKANISNTDVVYIYQNQQNIDKLENKLHSELKPGAMVITNTQSFKSWTPTQTFIVYPKRPEYEKMFLYVK